MNTETHYLTSIGDKIVEVPNELLYFDLYAKPSSLVSYFGVNYSESKLFVQFKSGKGYVYPNTERKWLDEAVTASSIGSYIQANFVKVHAKYEPVPYSITESKSEL